MTFLLRRAMRVSVCMRHALILLMMAFTHAASADPQQLESSANLIPKSTNNLSAGSSIEIEGTTAVVGWSSLNQVLVYEWFNSQWNYVQTITPSDTANQFGRQVRLSGGNMAVIASGNVYVFNRNASNVWIQQAKLTPAYTGDQGYLNVDLDGNVLVMGQPEPSNSQTYKGGYIYVYERTGSTWNLAASLQASDHKQYDNFARSVAIDGNYIIVAAYGSFSQPQGALYSFIRSGATWIEAAKFTPTATAQWCCLNNLSLSGTTLAVQDGQGSVFIFDKGNGNAWYETERIASYNDSVSYNGRVQLSGNELMVVDHTTIKYFKRYGGAPAGQWVQLAMLVPGDPDFDQGPRSIAFDSESGLSLVSFQSNEIEPGTDEGAVYYYDIQQIVDPGPPVDLTPVKVPASPISIMIVSILTLLAFGARHLRQFKPLT